MDGYIAAAGKRIAGAGLDVFEHEPKLPPALLKMKNVVLTPHLGSAVMELRDVMAGIDGTQVDALVRAILVARSVFTAGAGRSELAFRTSSSGTTCTFSAMGKGCWFQGFCTSTLKMVSESSSMS